MKLTIAVAAASLLLVSTAAEAQKRPSRSGARPTPSAGSVQKPETKPAASGSLAGRTSGESLAKTPPTGERRSSRNLSAAQQQNVDNLVGDLKSIKDGSQVTQQQKDDLKGSLSAIAEGATKPDPVLVEQLTTDLSAALSDSELSNREMIQLAQDIEAVMNSANIPKEEVDAAIDSAQAILESSGVDQEDVATIVADLQSIADAAQR